MFALPALKAIQPSQRWNVPKTIRCEPVAGISTGAPVMRLKRPSRGPTIDAATSATMPPHMWTTQKNVERSSRATWLACQKVDWCCR